VWPVDEEVLDVLEGIRAAYGPLADAGEEGAMNIVTAVDAMIREAHDWLSRAASRASSDDTSP
jgi:hypothetical protein